MLSVALSSLTVALSASLALAQGTTTPPPAVTTPAAPAQSTFPATPLAAKRFASPEDLPYKVDTDVGLIRGNQLGYNICNSTTAGQDSLCQTAYFNSIDDFCLWGPSEYGEEVGNIEGIMVAYCTKPGHGTRMIPADALQGVQWIKTRSYLAVTGYLDQTKINILEGDWGGEMDPRGADLRGNPMGGVFFSNNFTGSYQQVIEWHNFIGGNKFCFKACDPADADDEHFCEHIFDRIGCDYNIPSNAQNGTFESCLGDVQDFPGTYTGADGRTSTYTQPAGEITSIPYTARVPASSSCVQYQSASLYPDLPVVSTAAPTSTSGAGATSRPTTGTSRPSTGTSGGAGAQQTDTSGAARTMYVSGIAILGVVFSTIFFA